MHAQVEPCTQAHLGSSRENGGPWKRGCLRATSDTTLAITQRTTVEVRLTLGITLKISSRDYP